MAKSPKSTSRVSNIMGILRGNFPFDKPDKLDIKQSFGSPELLSSKQKNIILAKAVNVSSRNVNPNASPAALMGLVQSSVNKVGGERLENRKILQLMPEVDKAIKLIVASCFAPNDLSPKEVSVTFEDKSLTEEDSGRLSTFATEFFQEKLNLKTAAPDWVYQFGYESGSTIFAVIPTQSFAKIQDESFIGSESFIREVIEPLSKETIFGFGDTRNNASQIRVDVKGLESFSSAIILNTLKDTEEDEAKLKLIKKPESNPYTEKLISKIVGVESLSLTDNPAILEANSKVKEKVDKRTDDILKKVFGQVPKQESIVSVDPNPVVDEKNKDGYGDPILVRLPPESVSIIHTPGNPSDHIGYLVLLDVNGTPISAVTNDESHMNKTTDYNSNQGNIFAQVYNAYGVNTGNRGVSNEETNSKIYNQIVTQHLKNRLDSAGYSNIALGNSDAVMRCMFFRFMQAKQTRILFLPKQLVAYMTLEMDQNGYGVSQLDKIKFNLALKMTVQISKVLAALKAGMDKRSINVKFTENMMEDPEYFFQNVMREYAQKNTMAFSIDPNVVQTQIIDKSISIKGTDIPGMEQFDLTNEPDTRSTGVDIGDDLLTYIDKAIQNGLDVPASAMNSLSEDEYARSIVTTNLFFAMSIGIKQDIIVKCISYLLRIYAKYSQTFRDKLRDTLEGDKNKPNTKTIDDVSDTGFDLDDLISKLTINLPKPNVAPSKAQFEALEAMISAFQTTINALYSDDAIGKDDTLGPVIRTIRARLLSANVRNYLDGSGMNTTELPDTDFAGIIGELNVFLDALDNIKKMMDDKIKINEPTGSDTGGFGSDSSFGNSDQSFGGDDFSSDESNPDDSGGFGTTPNPDDQSGNPNDTGDMGY